MTAQHIPNFGVYQMGSVTNLSSESTTQRPPRRQLGETPTTT